MNNKNEKEPFIHNKNGVDRNGCDVLKLKNQAVTMEDFLEVINISSNYIEFYIEKMQYYRRLAAYREGVILALRKDKNKISQKLQDQLEKERKQLEY